MKTIIIHILDKRDFILSDHKHLANLCSNSSLSIPVELAKSEDRDFSCTKLALKKISLSRK